MSRKQDMTRERIWNKMRILCIITNLKTIRDGHLFNDFDTKIMNGWEQDCINESIENLEKIIHYWDEHTKHKIKNS